MGIIQTIFGGSKEKSESGNKAFDYLKGAYSPMVTGGTDAFGAYGNLLGLGGGEANKEAYSNFLDNSGYSWIMDEAMRGVSNSAAGKYLLRSGSTAKALQDRAANIGKTFFENYLNRLSDQSRLGLGAGGLIADAGQYSKGTGTSNSGGLGKAIGAGLALFSDAKLKKNIRHVDTLDDGLPIVDFEYRQDTDFDLPEGTFRGVLAQDIARLRPWALGPEIEGYMTIKPGEVELR